MRTAAPIRVPASRISRPAQSQRRAFSANRQLSRMLPLLGLMLTACESNLTGSIAFGVVSIIAFVAFSVRMIMKEDARKCKASRDEYDKRMALMQRNAERSRAEFEAFKAQGLFEIAQPKSIKATKSTTIDISMLQSENILLDCLRQGNKITVYRGFTPKYAPKIGQTYTRTFGGTAKRRATILKDSPIEQLIEEVRQKIFPDSPSRLDSVFATTSISDAREWGDAYELEISLKPEAAEAKSMPVRWLDRHTFDCMQSFSISQARELLEKIAEDYWKESGSHQDNSDILLDPNLVEIRGVVLLSLPSTIHDFQPLLFAQTLNLQIT
jgi:hypothetical protein